LPEAPRRSRPLARHRDVYTEADGLFGRLADLVIENPVRSGGFVTILLFAGAIVTNAAYFQTARHPDPFFVTRPEAQPPAAPIPDAEAARKAAAAILAGPDAEGSVADARGTLVEGDVPPPADGAARLAVANPVDTAEPGVPMPSLPKARPAPVRPMPAKLAPAKAPAGKALADKAVPVTPGLVADTQRALLASRFYEGPVDGILGPQTRSAISNFEMKIGLIPTGQPSSALLAKIRKGYPPVEPASTGSVRTASQQLQRIQHALNDIGYGPIPEDGREGAKTSNAIRRFELDNRLPPTGQASDAVAAKLVLIGAMKPG